MTVRALKRQLEDCDDDAIVYLNDPQLYTDEQDRHERLGARMVVWDGDKVWLVPYEDEAIDDEIDAIVEVAESEGWDEWDFYNELFNPDEHGYTLEDIRKNCPYRYDACKAYLETHAI